ncbi:MAG: hypothetical protein AABZ60_01475 [Planctomycetota bacterium]
MLEQLLRAVHHNPENILHYHAIIQLYKRNGDRQNEIKWLNEMLKFWPSEHGEEWLTLVRYGEEENDPVLCWKSLMSAYSFHCFGFVWPSGYEPPFLKYREAFFQFLTKNQHRYFELELTAPAISLYYMIGTLGGLNARQYFEDQICRIQQRPLSGVIFDWSRLRDVDTFLGGFLATAIESLQARQVPVYLIPPKNSNFQFLFQFLQLSQKLEKTQIPSELEALEQLKLRRASAPEKKDSP